MARPKKSNKVDTPSFIILEQEDKIQEKIKEIASNLNINDSTDMIPLMTEVFNNNTAIGLYKNEETGEPLDKKDRDKILKHLFQYDENKEQAPLDIEIDNYLALLHKIKDTDISKMNYRKFMEFVKKNNSAFLQYYVATIQPNLKDLLDEGELLSYAFKTIGYLVSLQKSEMAQIGYKEFANLDLSKANFMKYFSNETLTKIQDELKEYINNKFDLNDFINTEFYSIILTTELDKIVNKIKSDVDANLEFYEQRHKKHLEIKTLLKEITDKHNKYLAELVDKKSNRGIGASEDLYSNDITAKYQLIDNRLHKQLSDIENQTDQAVDMMLSSGKERGKVKTPVVLNIDIAETNIYGNRLDTWDTFILDTAFNLYEVGNRHLTPELIYKEMTGKTPNNIGKDIKDNIEKSINKLILTRLKLTLSPELVKRLGIDDETIAKLSVIDYALPMKETQIEYTNHQVKKGYVYNNEPIYFTFSKAVKQIKTMDRELLALDTGSSLTTNRLTIRYYLAREYERIKSTKGSKYENNKMSYDTIFDKCDLLKDIDKEINETKDEKRLISLKDKRKKYRQKYIQDVKEIVNQWQKSNLIKSYNEYPTDKRVKNGIEIVIK